MKIRVTFSVVFFILLINNSFAQNAEWNNYINKNWAGQSVDDGQFLWVCSNFAGLVKVNKSNGDVIFFDKSNSEIPSNNVSCIIKDSWGLTWIGTDKGLAVFNGANWILYNTDNSPLPSNSITSIKIDKQSNKWIGTDGGGLAKFTGVDWNVYTNQNSGLFTNYISSLFIDEFDNVWVGQYNRLIKYDGNVWIVYSIESFGTGFVQTIASDKFNNIWIGYWSGMAKFDGTNWTPYYPRYELGLPDNWIQVIAIDSANNKWFGSRQGLYKYDDIGWTVYDVANSGITGDDIYSITIDNFSNKWIGTMNGLVKLDGSDWTPYKFTALGGLLGQIITGIVIDDNNCKWIAASGTGLIKFDGINWSVFNTSNSPMGTNWINTIQKDSKGNIWLGTTPLLSYDLTNWTVYPSILFAGPIAFEDSSIIWIGTSNFGLYRFDGSNLTEYNTTNSGLLSNSFYSIAIDKNNKKWIGTYQGGLSVFNDTSWVTYSSSNSILPGDIINCIAVDSQNAKWIGTWEGLVKYDEKNWILYTMSNSGLPSNWISDVLPDSNIIWVGTNNGLAKFDGTNWTVFRTDNSGLHNNDITNLNIDKNGNLWIGTSNGISVYKEGGIISNLQTTNGNISPAYFVLSQNYPNPFNPTTKISYALPKSSLVQLKIYNLLGQEIATLVNEEIPAGTYEVNFNASNLSSGVYIYKMKAGEYVETRKMVLLK